MPTDRTAIRMPLVLRDAIDKKAGPGNRSGFIIDACYEKLGIHPPTAKTEPKAAREVQPIPKGKK